MNNSTDEYVLFLRCQSLKKSLEKYEEVFKELYCFEKDGGHKQRTWIVYLNHQGQTRSWANNLLTLDLKYSQVVLEELVRVKGWTL